MPTTTITKEDYSTYTTVSVRKDMCDVLIETRNQKDFMEKALWWLAQRDEKSSKGYGEFIIMNIIMAYKLREGDWKLEYNGKIIDD